MIENINGTLNLVTVRGYSAYQLAQLEESFEGTLQEYLNSLHGKSITSIQSDENGTLTITVEDLNGYKIQYPFYKVIPIKGTDYFTDDEINTIKQSISDILVTYIDSRFKDKTDISIKDITNTVTSLKQQFEKDVNTFQAEVKESVDIDLADKRDDILADIISEGEKTVQTLQNSSAIEIDKMNELVGQSDALLKEITDEKDSAIKQIEDLQSSYKELTESLLNKVKELETYNFSVNEEGKVILTITKEEE